MIGKSEIVRIAPSAAPYCDELIKQMVAAKVMANVRRASIFLGTIHVESGGFRSTEESLNYSADGLANTWPNRYAEKGSDGKVIRVNLGTSTNPKWRNKPNDLADILHRTPRSIANNCYASRMGNGNEASGDGWKFRGRGLKQLTGRDNYRRFSRAWLGDESLLQNPDRVANADGAVASAIWFWVANGLNEIADKGSVDAVTKVVNGGSIGIADRKTWTTRYAGAWRAG